jgi:transposase InsO family protein
MRQFGDEKPDGRVYPEDGVGVSGVGEKEDRRSLQAAQRLMILDLAMKSGLPVKEFAELVGVSFHTLYTWKKRYDEQGPEGLMEHPRKVKETGSRLPEMVRRSILMIKESHPEYGCERISDMLGRGPGLSASPNAVLRVIREAGLEVASPPQPAHGVEPKRFERARPNQMWQTDIFTFMLKRENRRLYMVVFLDDHSRYVVGYGVHASMGGMLVVDTLRAAISAYGPPEEVLTDNGPQYRTWRGKSRFTKELTKLGIRHILARPGHPQTVGKTERFWGTLWRECVEGAVFVDMEDARKRVGHFIDHYNFQRPHQGIGGLVPADRFFEACEGVKKTLESRVAANALNLARDGAPRKPFYLTGRVGDVDLSIHAEGERVVLNTADGRREEVDLRVPGRRVVVGEQAEVVPEPVAVHGEMNGDKNEVGDDGSGEEGTAYDNGEHGGEEECGGDTGGAGRSPGDAGGGEGTRGVADEVLRAGGAGVAGDGDGVGTPGAWKKDVGAGGHAGVHGEGAGADEEGGFAAAGAFADDPEERAHAWSGWLEGEGEASAEDCEQG